jgi:hypothetical protein
LVIIELDQQHLYHLVLLGECIHAAAWHTHPQNSFASIERLAVKIAKLYIGMIYNLATILFSDRESPNRFVWGIIL